MVAEGRVHQSPSEGTTHDPIRRRTGPVVQHAQPGKRAHFPPFHFCHQNRQTVRTTVFERHITAHRLKNFAPESLDAASHRPGGVGTSFLEHPIFIFTNDTACNAKLRVAGELMEQILVVIGAFKGNIGVQRADEIKRTVF